MSETFKSYFETLVGKLDINIKFVSEETVSNELVTDIITKFQNHPSIIKIKKNHQRYFNFSAVDLECVNRRIDSMDASKAM